MLIYDWYFSLILGSGFALQESEGYQLPKRWM